MKLCKNCNIKNVRSHSATYCSDSCKAEYRAMHRQTTAQYVTNWRKAQKRRCIEYKGGACVFCGYNKCYRSLDLHHVDPEEKEFNFGDSRGRSWARLIPELDKCILVCRNCHGEIHDGLITQDEVRDHW